MKKVIFFLKNRFTAFAIDALAIPIAWFGAYWLRSNLGSISAEYLLQALHIFFPLLIIQSACFWLFGLYRGIWRFASLPDFIRIIKAVIIGALIILLISFIWQIKIPRSILPIYAWLLFSLLGGTRALYRWLKDYRNVIPEGKRVLVVGAGSAAEMLLRDLIRNDNIYNYHPIVLVDDNKERQGCEIQGIRIAGFLQDIPRLVKKYNIQLVIIAIPSAKAKTMREVVALCEEAKVEFRTIPALNDLILGRASIKNLQDVSLEDLLGRDPVSLDWSQISLNIGDKRILVSGGGGSIGSELCRQIAQLAPSLLIIIDNSEFNLYSIENELRRNFPNIRLAICLLDINDFAALNKVIDKYKPQIIFHAAAYKHVPMLESQVRVAMQNNILGTYNMAKAAVDNSIRTFILISTDKAVNPANVMGATKRAAEVICQNYNANSNTRFITVRFGNVLGSAGSVVPLFQAQIAKGMDLTVTHPEVSRYFMTIPEACQLILQAAVIGKGGEIFVLDMGEPIKISFLAEQLIHLSGKKLGEDVNIVYTGLRPGEKLHEELFHEAEDLVKTGHEKILQAQYRPWNWQELLEIVMEIKMACGMEEDLRLKELLLKLVPEYKNYGL